MKRSMRVIHFRRCHVCGAVTEQHERIERCGPCGKPIVPFLYFDERTVSIPSAEGMRTAIRNGDWIPLLGLSVCWGSEFP